MIKYIFIFLFLASCGLDTNKKISFSPIPLKHYPSKNMLFLSCQLFLWGKESKTSSEIKLPTDKEISTVKKIGSELGKKDTKFKELEDLKTSLEQEIEESSEYKDLCNEIRELKRKKYALEKALESSNEKDKLISEIMVISQNIKDKEEKKRKFFLPLDAVNNKLEETKMEKNKLIEQLDSLVDYYNMGPSDIQLIFLDSKPNILISNWDATFENLPKSYSSFPKEGYLELIKDVSFEENGGRLKFTICADSSCGYEFKFDITGVNYEANDGKIYFSGEIVRIKNSKQKRYGVIQLTGRYKS